MITRELVILWLRIVLKIYGLIINIGTVGEIMFTTLTNIVEGRITGCADKFLFPVPLIHKY